MNKRAATLIGTPVTKKILRMFGSSIVGFWPMTETHMNVAYDISGNGLNGTISAAGVAIASGSGPRKKPSPLFSAGSIDIYSTSLNTLFNNTEGSLIIWNKVTSTVWGDGTNDCMLHVGKDATTNYVRLLKSSTANKISGSYMAGSSDKTRLSDAQTTTDWFLAAFTYSVSGNAGILYFNGVKQGATLTTLGTWSGNLATTFCQIGAQVKTTPALPENGYLQYALILNRAATASEFISLYNMS